MKFHGQYAIKSSLNSTRAESDIESLKLQITELLKKVDKLLKSGQFKFKSRSRFAY